MRSSTKMVGSHFRFHRNASLRMVAVGNAARAKRKTAHTRAHTHDLSHIAHHDK